MKLTDEDDLMQIEELERENKEVNGKVLSSNQAHPFIQSVSMLQVFFGIFLFVVIMEPMFVEISTDPVTSQLTMFAILVVLAFAISVLMRGVRKEEDHLLIRSRGYSNSHGLSQLFTFVDVFFALVVLAKLISDVAAERLGGLARSTTYMIAFVCAVTMILIMIVLERYKRSYVQSAL